MSTEKPKIRRELAELALLFEEVAAIAAEGAESLHRLAAFRDDCETEGVED